MANGKQTCYQGVYETGKGYYITISACVNGCRHQMLVYEDENGKPFETAEEAYLCKERTKTVKTKGNVLIANEWREKLIRENIAKGTPNPGRPVSTEKGLFKDVQPKMTSWEDYILNG